MKFCLFLFSFLFTLPLWAANAPTKSDTTVPYLGPGADKMNPQEYQRVYKDYIQQTIQLGFPLVHGAKNSCDQALQAIFRQVGMFAYPVPAEAQGIQRTVKTIAPYSMELYEMAGITLQLLRDQKSGALDRIVLVNSASTKASRTLSPIARAKILFVEKDKKTGLERLSGLPIGYPHPFLDPGSQGLFVRELRFNKSLDACAPIAYTDNSWVGGANLSDTICVNTESDVKGVWEGKLSPHDFADKERARMKEAMRKNAIDMGASAKDADAMIARQFVEPLSSDINVVGSAMKNLAQCHQLAIGSGSAAIKGATPDGEKGSGGASKGAE